MSASPRLPRSPLIGAGSLIGSVLVHVLLVGAGALLVSAGLHAPAATALPGTTEVAVDVAPLVLPKLSMGMPSGQTAAQMPEPTDEVDPGGGEPVARPDSHRKGRGGTARADHAALNLSDRDEGLTLSREVTSRIDRDQIQRLDTQADRASNEDRRSTTHPMDLIFLATGTGHLAER